MFCLKCEKVITFFSHSRSFHMSHRSTTPTHIMKYACHKGYVALNGRALYVIILVSSRIYHISCHIGTFKYYVRIQVYNTKLKYLHKVYFNMKTKDLRLDAQENRFSSLATQPLRPYLDKCYNKHVEDPFQAQWQGYERHQSQSLSV